METTINHGVLTGNKVSELRDETFSEFSNAPLEFEETASALWDGTQKVYYHACTANRFSENYLIYCTQLEKNIKQLGSFCLTKAVLEQKGMAFPKLKYMRIHELVCMTSFHFRKAHAALDGIYRDNNILGMTYLDWEFRWVVLCNRLKATEVKIQKIKEGKINVDSMLEEAETFKGDPRTNAELQKPKSLNINPAALPLNGAIAREMVKSEKESAREAEQIQKEKERMLKQAERLDRQAARMTGGIGLIKPFGLDKEDMALVKRKNAEALRKQAEELNKPREPERIPGGLTEAEARKILIEDAMKRNDQTALLAIPKEDSDTLHDRWLRYTARVEREAIQSRYGPPPETRKALREKRKKKRK